MAGNTLNPIRGNYLSILAGTDEFNGHVKAWSLTPEETNDDDLSFLEAAGDAEGGNWNLGLTVYQDMDSDSLWRFIYDNQGDTVVFTLKTKNAAVSADNPAWVVPVTLSLPFGSVVLGAEASRDKTRAATEFTLACETAPVMDVTP